MKSTTSITLAACASLALAAGVWWWMQHSAKSGEGERGAQAAAQVPSTAPSPKPARDFLHPKVRILINPEPIGYGARVNAASDLPPNLSPQDLTAVMDFMNGAKPGEMKSDEWHALVDSLINSLRRQDTAPEGLTDALVQLYHHGADSVLKDYAIQYLRYWFTDRETRYKHETRPDARARILATLVHGAHALHESYSGAALMALDHVTTAKALREEPETQAMIQSQLKDFDALLFQAVSSSDTHKLCRISAIQVAAMRGTETILPIVRTLAADPATDPNIRISAIAAIGQLGDITEDKDLLTRLGKSGQRLAYAAKPALEKLALNAP